MAAAQASRQKRINSTIIGNCPPVTLKSNYRNDSRITSLLSERWHAKAAFSLRWTRPWWLFLRLGASANWRFPQALTIRALLAVAGSKSVEQQWAPAEAKLVERELAVAFSRADRGDPVDPLLPPCSSALSRLHRSNSRRAREGRCGTETPFQRKREQWWEARSVAFDGDPLKPRHQSRPKSIAQQSGKTADGSSGKSVANAQFSIQRMAYAPIPQQIQWDRSIISATGVAPEIRPPGPGVPVDNSSERHL